VSEELKITLFQLKGMLAWLHLPQIPETGNQGREKDSSIQLQNATIPWGKIRIPPSV